MFWPKLLCITLTPYQGNKYRSSYSCFLNSEVSHRGVMGLLLVTQLVSDEYGIWIYLTTAADRLLALLTELKRKRQTPLTARGYLIIWVDRALLAFLPRRRIFEMIKGFPSVSSFLGHSTRHCHSPMAADSTFCTEAMPLWPSSCAVFVLPLLELRMCLHETLLASLFYALHI